MNERSSSEPTAHTCRRCYAPYVLLASPGVDNPRSRVRLCGKCFITYEKILKRLGPSPFNQPDGDAVNKNL